MIDAAIERGDFEVVNKILNSGANLTEDSLTAAVRSRNQDLVYNLLQRRTDAGGFSRHFRSTPYAEAIRQANSILVSTLENFGSLQSLDQDFRFTATLAAAAEIGDHCTVQKMHSLASDNTHTLGYALFKACEQSHNDVA